MEIIKKLILLLIIVFIPATSFAVNAIPKWNHYRTGVGDYLINETQSFAEYVATASGEDLTFSYSAYLYTAQDKTDGNWFNVWSKYTYEPYPTFRFSSVTDTPIKGYIVLSRRETTSGDYTDVVKYLTPSITPIRGYADWEYKVGTSSGTYILDSLTDGQVGLWGTSYDYQWSAYTCDASSVDSCVNPSTALLSYEYSTFPTTVAAFKTNKYFWSQAVCSDTACAEQPTTSNYAVVGDQTQTTVKIKYILPIRVKELTLQYSTDSTFSTGVTSINTSSLAGVGASAIYGDIQFYLTGLTAGTKYYFRPLVTKLGDTDVTTTFSYSYFNTAPVAGSTFKLIFIGDMHGRQSLPLSSGTTTALKNENALAVFTTGDDYLFDSVSIWNGAVCGIAKTPDWVKSFGAPYWDFAASLNTAVYQVTGNHDGFEGYGLKTRFLANTVPLLANYPLSGIQHMTNITQEAWQTDSTYTSYSATSQTRETAVNYTDFSGARAVREVLPLPSDTDDRSAKNFAVTLGDVKIISFEPYSNQQHSEKCYLIDLPDPFGISAIQSAWIKNEIETSTEKWIILLAHAGVDGTIKDTYEVDLAEDGVTEQNNCALAGMNGALPVSCFTKSVPAVQGYYQEGDIPADRTANAQSTLYDLAHISGNRKVIFIYGHDHVGSINQHENNWYLHAGAPYLPFAYCRAYTLLHGTTAIIVEPHYIVLTVSPDSVKVEFKKPDGTPITQDRTCTTFTNTYGITQSKAKGATFYKGVILK